MLPAILLVATITACDSALPNNREAPAVNRERTAAADSAAVRARQAAGETFREPPVIGSRRGVLQISLTAAPSMISVAGLRAQLMTYNGLYMPPTLRVHSGDTIRIRLTNSLAQPTNLHAHGFSVSPLGNSDNVMINVAPGRTQNYEIRLPRDHPPGLYWYHPHAHGFSDVQVSNGMSGALIVDGLLDAFPTLRHLPERLFLFKDLQVKDGRAVHMDIGKNTVRTINGVVNPVIVLRPGETELWRMANIGADVYYLLTLDARACHHTGYAEAVTRCTHRGPCNRGRAGRVLAAHRRH